ncbi:MAG TPA: hypothetical protein VKV79_05405 [Terriglobia bacterium]|nr:hypothetical protein [Terriglobia bacterium]
MPVAQWVLGDAVKLLILVLGLVYAALVFAGYVTEGPHYQPRFHLEEPARSGERLLVWTGIKLLVALVRLCRSLFNQLLTASGEVGFWIVNKSGPKVQREVRSRFL